jgi:hypothetical protein
MNALHGAIIDRVPSHAADIVAEIVEGEVLIYHPQQTKALYLNPTAGAIWSLCDGRRSVRDIIMIVQENYPECAAILTDDVLTTLAELRGSGVLVIT